MDTITQLELDKEYILSKSFPILRCGIYFLIKDGEIVYVGQSVNIPSRLSDHLANKDFGRVFFIECKEEDLNLIERQYIKKFSPKLNSNLIETPEAHIDSWHNDGYKWIRINASAFEQLQKLAEIIQEERGLRRPDLGIAAEAAIEEAIASRKKTNKIVKSATSQQCNE